MSTQGKLSQIKYIPEFIIYIYIIIILLLQKIFTSTLAFHWSLSDSKSPQIPRTLLSIMIDLSNTVDWMVSIRSLIFKSSGPCTNPLVTVPNVPITISIIVPFLFDNFFSVPLQDLDIYFSFRSLSVLSCGQPEQQSPPFTKIPFFVVVDCHQVWKYGWD